MYRETPCDIVALTPSVTRSFSRLPTFGGDRDRESIKGRVRVAWLKHLIEEGLFFSPVWATADYAGKTFRVDGGHSSLALTEQADAGRPFPKDAFAIIRRFECECETDFALLFSQFDNRKSLRTFADKLKPHLLSEGLLDEIAPSYAAPILRGITYAIGKDTPDRIDEDARVALVHDFQDFILWARPYVAHRFLARAGVTAAMLDTWTIDTAAATLFWDEVRLGSNPDINSPSRILANFLQNAKAETTKYKSAWDTRAFYAKCIHAWNAHCEGRRTNLKYRPSCETPKAAGPK